MCDPAAIYAGFGGNILDDQDFARVNQFEVFLTAILPEYLIPAGLEFSSNFIDKFSSLNGIFTIHQ